MSFVNQTSEIGTLKTVLLHRPDVEIAHIIPDYREQMLTDDLPHLPSAKKEHDEFAATLRNNGVNVLYVSQLFCDALENKPDARAEFVDEYLALSAVQGERLRAIIRERLVSLDAAGLFRNVLQGIMRRDFEDIKDKPIQLSVHDPYPFLIDPMPNLYFTRDIGASIKNGLLISCMSKRSRKLETLLLKYIVWHNPLFAEVPLWYDSTEGYEIEGGDVLILSDKVLAVGCGERTSVSAVEKLALTLFGVGYERVLLFNNPKSRKFMHLDVLCTMVDRDKFLVDSCIADKQFEVYELTKSKSGVKIIATSDPVDKLFKRALGLPSVKFIETGGGDPIAAARDHWNMGSNSLAISPGAVVTYDRNDVTNELLVKNGVKVFAIAGSELARGRGGPRCMSMPIFRENI